jgi:hypothetical protein
MPMTVKGEIEQHIRQQTKLEMDEHTFQILDSILRHEFAARLMVTRASVGDKIVAVIKGNGDD